MAESALKKAEIENQLCELNSELKRLNAVIEIQNRTLIKKQKTSDAVKKNILTETPSVRNCTEIKNLM